VLSKKTKGNPFIDLRLLQTPYRIVNILGELPSHYPGPFHAWRRVVSSKSVNLIAATEFVSPLVT